MALTDLTRISTSGIATGSTIDSPILRKDVSLRGSQVGVTSALFDSSDDALEFNDNVKLKLGNGGDLELYHNNESIISHSGAGVFKIQGNGSNNTFLRAKNAQNSITLVPDGEVILHNNGTPRFETTSYGVVVTGILTATSFSGPVVGNTNNASGISTFYDLRVTNNLTVEGTTTTLDTDLTAVDRIEVGANSNSVVGIAVTQSGTADIVNLFDGGTEIVKVASSTNAVKVTHSGGYGLRVQRGSKFLDFNGDWATSGNTAINAGASGIRFYYGDSSDGIQFNTGSGDDKVRIKSNGNVGINSTSPSTKLEVVGENGSTATFKSAVSPHLLVTSDANLNEYLYQSVENGVTIKSTEPRLDIIAEGSGTHAGSFLIRDNSHDGFGFVNDFTNKELQLKSFTSSNTNFTINSTGSNVSRLDNCIVIKKDGSVSLFHDGAKTLETKSYGFVSEAFSTDPNILVHKVGHSRGGLVALQTQRFALATTTNGDDIVFGFGSAEPITSSNFTERLRIDNGTGNVGIGTDDPLTELHIHGETFTDITIHSQRTSGNIGGINFRKGGITSGIMTAQYLVDVSGNHYFYSQGSQRLKSSSDGDLLISGADNAELKLKCGTSSGNNIIAFQNSGGTTRGNITYDSDNNFLLFNVNQDERLRITSSGKVGIGTDNPVGKLHIWSTGPDILLTDSNQATDNRNWILSAATSQILRLQAQNDSYAGGGNLFDFYRSGNNINELRGMNAGNYWFVVNNSTKRVGIGTDNPTYVLHTLENGVVGSTENDRKYNGRFTTHAGNRLNLDIYDRRWQDTQTHGWIGTEKRIEYNVDDNTTKRMWMSFLNPSSTTANNVIRFGEQEDTEWMRIYDGNVGINSTNPNSKLTVASGSATAQIEIQRTNGSGGGTVGVLNFTGVTGYSVANISAVGQGNNDGAHLVFRTTDSAGEHSPFGGSTNEHLRITSGGKIGIATATPTAKLTIGRVTGGYMNTTGIQVNRPHSLGLQNGVLVYTDAGFNNTATYRAAAFKAVGTSGIAFAVSTDAGNNGLGGTLNAKIDFDGDAHFLGNTGIGTDNPLSRLHVTNASGTDPLLRLHHSNADVEGEVIRIGRTELPTIRYHSIKAKHSGNSLANYISVNVHDGGGNPYTSQTEVARFLGAGGMTFNGDTATANALDDYETGTFTPVMYGHTTGTGSNTVSGAGYYVKVGDVCTIALVFANKNGTGLPTGENLHISGIPFAFKNGPSNQTSGVPFIYNVDFNTSHIYTFIGGNNVTYIRGYLSRAAATWQPWSTTNWRVSTFYMYLNMTYITS